jgi:hypothetical protein
MDTEEEARKDAVRIASEMLAGNVDLAVGCRKIQKPLACLGLRLDPDYVIFVGFDSETDHLAIGDERRHWSPDGLRKSDEELSAAIKHYRPHIVRACQTVIKNLQADQHLN